MLSSVAPAEVISLMERMPLPMAWYNPSLQRMYVNQSFCQIARQPLDALVGLKPSGVHSFSIEQAQRYEQALASVMASGQAQSFDLVGRLPGGGTRCSRLHLLPDCPLGGGDIRGVLVVSTDISSLKATERRLIKVQDLSRTGDWEWSRPNANIVVSEQFLRVLETQRQKWRLRDVIRHFRSMGLLPMIAHAIRAKQTQLQLEHVLRLHGRPDKFLTTWLEFDYGKDGRLIHILGVTQDASETHRLLDLNERLTHFDMLTGLANRALFTRRLAQAQASRATPTAGLSVMVVKLLGLQQINSTLGRVAGDEIIKICADRLRQVCSEREVGRLSGDQFVAFARISPSEQPGQLQLDGELPRAVSLLQRPLQHPSGGGDVKLMMGWTTDHDGVTDASALIEQASLAMRSARNAPDQSPIRRYVPQMEEDLQVRYRMDQALNLCIERQALRLQYQPKVDILTQQIIGAEALMRWHAEPWGCVSPAVFIPLAENSGHIVGMGRWALEQACRLAVDLRRTHGTFVKMAVNVSPRQIYGENLLEVVREVLQDTACPPEALELEITESLLLGGSDEILFTLKQLKNLGVSIALDDFGTGFSSLSYLTRFPIDTLKVDRSFVCDLQDNPRVDLIAQTIVNMGRGLNMSVVAEGVETVEQALRLQEMGCHIGQGWLYGKPVDADVFAAQWNQPAG